MKPVTRPSAGTRRPSGAVPGRRRGLLAGTGVALALLAGLAALPAAAGEDGGGGGGTVLPRAKEGHSYPECYCTDSRGQRVEVGEMACLRIGDRRVTSRCTKVRNLVIWRHSAEGCKPGV